MPTPVDQYGNVRLIQGDDYYDDDNNALRWEISNYDDGDGNLLGPDLTSATLTMRVMTKADYEEGTGSSVLEVAGTATMDGTTAVFLVELTSDDTDALDTSPATDRYSYVYQLVVETSEGHEVTVFITDTRRQVGALTCRRAA